MPSPDQHFVTRSEWTELSGRVDRLVVEVRGSLEKLRRRDVHHDELIASNRAMLAQLVAIAQRLDNPRPPKSGVEDWARWGAGLGALVAAALAHGAMTRPMPTPSPEPIEYATQDSVQPAEP